jgi:hypothetical protein
LTTHPLDLAVAILSALAMLAFGRDRGDPRPHLMEIRMRRLLAVSVAVVMGGVIAGSAPQPLEVVGAFGQAGHWAGQFYGAHNSAADSKGNLFITETYEGKRGQKFL